VVEIKLFTQDFFSKPAVQDIVADLSDLVVGVRSKHRGDRLYCPCLLAASTA